MVVEFSKRRKEFKKLSNMRIAERESLRTANARTAIRTLGVPKEPLREDLTTLVKLRRMKVKV